MITIETPNLAELSTQEEANSDTMVMINTCCQGQGSYDNVDNPVWIEQKNYIATAREAMYDSTCNICLMNLFDTDEDEDVHCIAACQCLFHKECLTEHMLAQI